MYLGTGTELTANINPHEHVFFCLNNANINPREQFTVLPGSIFTHVYPFKWSRSPAYIQK